jgi:hypothetical protein
LITKEGGMKKGDMDALISKRPLFWSCLSCDKNLDDYNGKLGEYKHWAMFPPKETSPERMGRVKNKIKKNLNIKFFYLKNVFKIINNNKIIIFY